MNDYIIYSKKQQCSSEVNSAEWNTILSTVIVTHNAQLEIFPKTLTLFLKEANNHVEEIGEITVNNKKTDTKLRWYNQAKKDIKGSVESTDIMMPKSFKELVTSVKERSTDCATGVKDIGDINDITRVMFAGAEDQEWWTMVSNLWFFFNFLILFFIFSYFLLYLLPCIALHCIEGCGCQRSWRCYVCRRTFSSVRGFYQYTWTKNTKK